MIFNVTGGGGAGLNFKLIAVASKDALPATAAENTIAVVIGTAINGYAFSAAEPKNPVEGMVWIPVGTSSSMEFNALKKNSIQVYPLFAKQYISGAFITVSSAIYQNGRWNNFGSDLWLFHGGDQSINVTGGWSRDGYKVDGYDVSTLCGFMNDGTWMYCTGISGAHGCMGTQNKIDLSMYKTIRLFGKTSNPIESSQLFICNSKNFDSGDDVLTVMLPTEDGEISADISGLSGQYYIAFGASANAGATSWVAWVKLEV